MLKVVIADDENTIRTGLSVLINKSPKYEVVAVCKNGQEAYEAIVKYNPHLVITDIRMPVMDGLTLITRCQELNLQGKFIILSGYSDFEYARTGLRLGAFDYVVKPVNHDSLENLLDRIAIIIDNEIEDQKQLKNQAGLLCLQNLGIEMTENWLRKMKINLDSPQVIVVNLQVPCYEELLFKTKIEIENFLEKSLWRNYIGLVYKKMVVLILNRVTNDQESILTLGNELRAFLKKNFNIPALLGIGRRGNGLSWIATSYQQAISALSESIYNTSQGIYTFNPERQVLDSKEHFYLKEKNLLFSTITDCNPDGANRIIDIFFRKADSQKYPPVFIFSFYNDLCQFIAKIISGVNRQEIPNFKELSGLIARNLTLDGIKEEMKKVVNNAIEQSNNIQIRRYGQTIYQILKYLHAHYDEELNENKICEQFYINISYFCKLFKTKTGVSFVKYLTNYRIKKAKELLLYENFNVNEIAGMVGYNNPKYFAKVFKGCEGLTPTEYRNSFSENR